MVAEAGMGNARGDTLLIQFAREPVVGAVKTRMIPHLSPAQACELHSQLVLWTCQRLLASRLGTVQIAVAGDPGHSLFTGFEGVATLTRQRGRDLGERMCHALAEGLAHYSRVLLVGSDCPAIDGSYLEAALAALEREPLVLGPAEDGGYVLVGARELCREMFEDIPWGAATVYAETAERLRSKGRSWAVLPAVADIDRPEDLATWRELQGRQRG